MRPMTGSTTIQRNLQVAIPVFATAWLVMVPSVFTTATFLTLTGLLAAFGWVVKTTYLNGRTADSVGQLIQETEQAGARGVPRVKR